jgi:hypothetical protein
MPNIMPPATAAVPSALTSGGQVTSAMLKNINVDTALYWIHSARRDSTRKEIDGLAMMVRERTEQMKALNKLVETLQTSIAFQEKRGDGPGSDSYLNETSSSSGQNAANLTLYADLRAAGCNMSNTRIQSSHWINPKDDKAIMIQLLKTQLEALNSIQSMDMQRLDSLNKKYNESTEWLTNFERSRSQTATTISQG